MLERILQNVQKPGRYTGGELGSVVKNRDSVDIRYAFCFPDTYEIGMSHLGMRILYSLVNDRDDAWCERVFAPWVDMEEQMRKNDVRLFALESGDEIKDFDIIGFTLQYEMCYTNVLNMLDLAGLPVRSADRPSLTPLIVAGGSCVCNPEPIAPFVDICLPGEGEEVTNELIDLLKQYKHAGADKHDFLIAASHIKGVYVPSLYEPEYNNDGTLSAVRVKEGAPEMVQKRIVTDLDEMYFPERFVVPSIEIVHDRTTVEVFRGCTRGCRFCQAGFIFRPIREKSPEIADRQCRQICDSSGYDEVSLCSLSTSDYTSLEPLLERLVSWTDPQKINIALPSLRIDNFPQELMEKITGVRRSSLTFAPEAGTQRLRDVINKNITEQEVLKTAAQAFSGGWTAVKLYFMIGLPTETDEDIEGIARLAQKVVDAFYSCPEKPKGRSVNVSVSVASFVPKPFTPFQRQAQNTRAEIVRKQTLLRSLIRTKKITLSFHEVNTSCLEAVLTRADRRVANVIEAAWRSGCRFDSWDDHFRFDLWEKAFEQCSADMGFYANRQRGDDELLPWSHIDYGISDGFLRRECEKAMKGETTPPCSEKCAGCGANKQNGGECHALGKNAD